MHQQISKKIYIYLFIFFLLGTFSNKNFLQFSFPKIDSFEVIGLNKIESDQISQDLLIFEESNLFLIKKKKISNIINSNKIIEKFSIFKKYPSKITINVKKTKFLAYTKINNVNFYIGSNGNLIKIINNQIELPFIFGSIEIKEFLKLKKIIDNSSFNYDNIKNLYYFKSKRWDIETKDNLIIKLPTTHLEDSFKILLKIYKKEEFKGFKVIDLRQNNQVISNG